ncbi:leucine rich repeat containing protein BspA family protein, partial [Entamoeba invadens IP1]
MVCKKFQGNMDKFHNNPVPINKKTIKFFPKIETLNLWNCDNEVFGNDLFNRKKLETTTKIDFFQINVWFVVTYDCTQTHLH